VKRKKRRIEAELRDLTLIAIVAAAGFILAINTDNSFFAPIFAVEAVASVLLAVRIANAPHSK
jgi:hypothetical protein